MSGDKERLLFALIVDLRKASKTYREAEGDKARKTAKADFESKLSAVTKYVKAILRGSGDDDKALNDAANRVISLLVGAAGPQGGKVLTKPFAKRTPQETASAHTHNGTELSDALELRVNLLIENAQGIDSVGHLL